jgi:[ribosomal protein S18]-alanine N-acetyltransferase
MAASLKIRSMKAEDIPGVAQLENACFTNPWPEKEIEYEFKENPCSKIVVALLEETIVGYLDFMITFDSATINRICVTMTERQKGIAQALLDKMVEIAKRQKETVEFITLEVRSSNMPALNLYKKNGWEEITVKKHYYDDGEDAIYMVRSIL